jgi:hypothetical protein
MLELLPRIIGLKIVNDGYVIEEKPALMTLIDMW